MFAMHCRKLFAVVLVSLIRENMWNVVFATIVLCSASIVPKMMLDEHRLTVSVSFFLQQWSSEIHEIAPLNTLNSES